MRGRYSVIGEITSLRGSISEYRSNIIELEDAKNYICRERYKLIDVSSEVKAYDVTRNSRWLGKLNDLMSDNIDAISYNMLRFISDVDKFICDIDDAVSKLKTMIDECLAKIAELENELSDLEVE